MIIRTIKNLVLIPRNVGHASPGLSVGQERGQKRVKPSLELLYSVLES